MLTVVVGDDYAEVLKATELSAPRGRTEWHGIPSQDAVTETHAHASGHAGGGGQRRGPLSAQGLGHGALSRQLCYEPSEVCRANRTNRSHCVFKEGCWVNELTEATARRAPHELRHSLAQRPCDGHAIVCLPNGGDAMHPA